MTRDWYPIVRQHKNVTLCDVCVSKSASVNNIRDALMGMGLCEWETYMGCIFSQAVLKALERGENEADITKMFSCDLVGVDDMFGEYTKPQADVCAFLKEKLFKVVSETEDELRVRLKWNVIKHQ